MNKNNIAPYSAPPIMETLGQIFERLKIEKPAENVDLNEFKTEVVAHMTVYQLQKNLKMDKEDAKKLFNEFSGFRSTFAKRPRLIGSRMTPPPPKKCETEFSKKFAMLPFAKIPYKPGDEWTVDICGAAYSSSSAAFQKIFKRCGEGSPFGDPNTLQNDQGWTPLMYATAMGRENLVDLMLREKVTTYLTQNSDGRTAMMIAASFGHSEIIKILYNGYAKHCEFVQDGSHHSDILQQQDNRGWSPLHYAAAHAQLDAVEVLVAYGANPNLLDSSSNTPTLLACEDEIQEGCLKVLVQAGGNLELKNAAGKNGLEIADRDSIYKLYQKFTKKIPIRHFAATVSPHRYGSF